MSHRDQLAGYRELLGPLLWLRIGSVCQFDTEPTETLRMVSVNLIVYSDRPYIPSALSHRME